MADGLEKGKKYLKYVYEKITVAVAIAVIRSRPENLSLEDYIESLKAPRLNISDDIECNNGAAKDVSSTLGDISQQQILFNKLWAVFPNTCEKNSTEKSRTDDEDLDMSQDLFSSQPNERNENCDSDGAEEADTNMRFIQAIVQLKSIINSRSTVPAHKFQDILELFLSSEELGRNSYENKKSDNNESISCCALRYVMRSSETNKLLYFAVQKVLSYLGQSIRSSWWDGYDDTSLISHAIKTVKHVVDFASARNDCMGICLGACLKFVTDLVNDISNGEDLNKGEIWERHCMLIIEFCKSRYLCVNTISYIVEVLINICKELESFLEQERMPSNGCCCGSRFNPHRLENSWYLLHVTKVLLTCNKEAEWSDHCAPSNIECSDAEASDVRKIRDLWRSSWKGSESQPVDDEILNSLPSLDASVIVKWKEQLNHYVQVLSQHYPLLTFDLYECEKLLI